MSSVRASIQDQSPPECWKTYGNITWPPVKTVNCTTGPTGLSKPLPSWLYMKSSFGKSKINLWSTHLQNFFKIVWSSWPQTMEMKDLRRKSKGSWTRMSGMQLALRRLDGLAFPMVLQRMILGLAENRFWKARPASQAPIVTAWK